MSSFKAWGILAAALILLMLGWYIYVTYLQDMPLAVWRFSSTVWAAWASWHTYRLAFK